MKIGIDIVYIPRIERIVREKPHFLEKYFSKEEKQLFEKRNMRAEVIAGNFAVKEAFSKAIGTGINFVLRDVSVLRDDFGAPYILFHKESMKKKYMKVQCSIAHEKEYAVATVLLEG